jgi:hypothetical protein
MKDNQLQHELSAIRALMEKSTRFLSLSGLAGVLAGIYALLGGWLALEWLTETNQKTNEIVWKISLLAGAILILSVSTGWLLTIRQARKNGETPWNPISRKLLIGMSIPLITGGLLLLILLYHTHYTLIAPVCLVFYGLALINAGQYSFPVVRNLGFWEIGLGLIAALFPEQDLLCWITGFGFLHIRYGLLIHLKLNR